MRRYGPPEVLTIETVPLAPLRADEIRLRSIASAINHSDLEIRAGNWPIGRAEPFPYVPGLEVVGEVVETGVAVSEFRPGERAITMMQGLGGVRARRPGGYAEFVTVAAAAAAPVPADLDPGAVAALGLASVTAWEGLSRLGPLDGRRIAITGAAGGVGSAAVGIAAARGARVVGIVSRAAQADYVRTLGAAEVLTGAEAADGGLGEETLDGILDAVAGAAFGARVAALRPGAALSLIGAVGGAEVSFDAYRLLNVTLTGYSSESLDGSRLRAAMVEIAKLLRGGRLAVPAITRMPLRDAAVAHERLERRQLHGRVLLVPG
jgi:NADPH2:quinone reductase